MASEEENEVEAKDYVYVALGINIWLEGKNDPLLAYMRVRFFLNQMPESIEDLTDVYANIILHEMDSRSTHVLTLEDERNNKVMINLDQVQGFMVCAPDVMPAELVREDDE